MIGTEKQVAWAENIRDKGLEYIDSEENDTRFEREKHLIADADAEMYMKAWGMVRKSFEKVFDDDVKAADVIENRVRYDEGGIRKAFNKACMRLKRTEQEETP